MKKILFLLALVGAGSTVRAQVNTGQVATIKNILVSKTWKTQATRINSFSPADFERSNNIHNVDAYPTGDRYKFASDGTFTIIRAVGGTQSGIWDINPSGQLVFNPGQNGGTTLGLTRATGEGFSIRTIRRLGMCSVTSLYEVDWVPAQ